MKTLGEFIVEKQHEFSHATGELTALLSAIKLGAKIIHRDINKAGLVDILGASGAENVQGEVQQKLDLFANEKLKAALKARDIVAGIASEEEDEIVVFEGCEHAKYVVLMDPLDGSSNIDVNVSVGTIFSIYRRVTPVGTPVTEEDFLQPGNKQVAAGYVVYGSSTMLVYTTGCGVHAFTYDPSLGVFCLCQAGYALAGVGVELDAIASVVIGGTLLSGGVGTVLGTLFGVAIQGLIQTYINFDGTLSSWWTKIAIGILLFIFIALQRGLTVLWENRQSSPVTRVNIAQQ